MAEVLVVVEASQAAGVKKVTLEMLTVARSLGSVSAVVFGSEDHSARLGEFGAEKIYAGSGDDIDGYRGSLMVSHTLTTAGVEAVTTS